MQHDSNARSSLADLARIHDLSSLQVLREVVAVVEGNLPASLASLQLRSWLSQAASVAPQHRNPPRPQAACGIVEVRRCWPTLSGTRGDHCEDGCALLWFWSSGCHGWRGNCTRCDVPSEAEEEGAGGWGVWGVACGVWRVACGVWCVGVWCGVCGWRCGREAGGVFVVLVMDGGDGNGESDGTCFILGRPKGFF